MSEPASARAIRLRGARQNNLKNLDLDLPLGKLIVVTGLSGSGKSSLAFDTLFAEGQRRYVETFSPYARQFLDRMDKPRVDRVENIPPAIAVEQRNAVRSTRSTVGTMTELTEFAKVLWLHLSQLYCRQCHKPVRKDHPQSVWDTLLRDHPAPESSESAAPADAWLILFEVPLSAKMSLSESIELIARQGYQRLLIDDEVVRVAEAAQRLQGQTPASLRVVQDRLSLQPAHRRRFIEACEQAFHFGKGRLTVYSCASKTGRRFSNQLCCAECDLVYKDPVPALFSFNHPLGACPACRGFGRTITIDYNLAIPDRNKTLAEGLVKPWKTATGAESQADLMKFCKRRGIPTNVPFSRLSPDHQTLVVDGEPGYGSSPELEWPRAWYGVKGYFRWLESKAYKMHVRVLLSRYRAYIPCPACAGRRFQPETLLYQLPDLSGPLLTLHDFYELPVTRALALAQNWFESRRKLPVSNPLRLALEEMLSRLQFLDQVGLGYLTLNRPTRSLSGGETERVNLTTCLGSRLVNTLFVLDEPTVGLHPRDTDRLVGVLEKLRDAGNTVVVVEHEARVMRAADQILDLGPGHGESGGNLVFHGSFQDLLRHDASLTGRYLRGDALFPPPRARPVPLDGKADTSASHHLPPGTAGILPASPSSSTPWPGCLVLANASKHNLQNLRVEIPLRRLVCLTGVSGSGKTTLVKQVLLPALGAKLEAVPGLPPPDDHDNEDQDETTPVEASATLTGAELLSRHVLVDQSSLGRTPRSTPALYVGAFDSIRDLFASSIEARELQLTPGFFSFNSAAGQCEKCHGAGFEKIEMQFLSDVFIRCPDCDGKRYRPDTLKIKLAPPGRSDLAWSIADMLAATIDEACDFLGQFKTNGAPDAHFRLTKLQEVGLGYLRLGQPINTLSGGECQRLKLARHLADSSSAIGETLHPTLFMFDEPTTGLHFEDVRVLLEVFQKLVDAGHSVLIIEHNLDVIRASDWIIDLGPGGGAEGGKLVATGPPGVIQQSADSLTGAALRADAQHHRPPVRRARRAR